MAIKSLAARPIWFIMALACAGVCAENSSVANLSGTWVLDAKQSKWGNHKPPTSIVISIEHHEPALKYSGQEIKPGEEQPREFSFDGAIDGKSYPVRGPGEEGTMYFKRVDPRTVDSVFTSKDHTETDQARTTLSADGKKMTREVKAQAPGGKESWTEVYSRR